MATTTVFTTLTSNFSNSTNVTALCDEEEDDSRIGLFIAGIILAFVGSTFESLGLTIQKLAQDKEDKKTAEDEDHKQIPYIKLKLWWVGFGVFLFGNILDFVALGLVPAAVVILVGSWALVLNLFTATAILGEQRTTTDYFAAGLIIVGIIVAVVGRPTVNTLWTTEQTDVCGTNCDTSGLQERLQETDAYVATIILFILVGSVIAVVSLKGGGQCGPAVGGGQKDEGNVPNWVKFLYVAQAALVATVTVGAGRGVASVIIMSGFSCELATGEEITYGNQFYGPAFGFIIIFLISLPSQIHFIAISLAYNEALVHIPGFYVIWQVGAAVFGGIVYEEYEGFEAENWAMYIIGVLTMFCGIYLVTKRMGALEAKLQDKDNSDAAVVVTDKENDATLDGAPKANDVVLEKETSKDTNTTNDNELAQEPTVGGLEVVHMSAL